VLTVARPPHHPRLRFISMFVARVPLVSFRADQLQTCTQVAVRPWARVARHGHVRADLWAPCRPGIRSVWLDMSPWQTLAPALLRAPTPKPDVAVCVACSSPRISDPSGYASSPKYKDDSRPANARPCHNRIRRSRRRPGHVRASLYPLPPRDEHPVPFGDPGTGTN